jgi:hypothetical protein
MTRTPSDVRYHGTQPHRGGAGVITVETVAGEMLGVVVHAPKHSTGGYSWGYNGSGPADAARSLLIAAIGPAALCECKHNRECDASCDLGYKHLPYQMFKEAVLVTAPDEWFLLRSWVRNWLERAEQTITMPATEFGANGWPRE